MSASHPPQAEGQGRDLSPGSRKQLFPESSDRLCIRELTRWPTQDRSEKGLTAEAFGVWSCLT